uniref:DNA polymerase n=1 Tax=Poriella subacida TaxID=2872513 RepID=UPI0030029069|nr:DNA polymerase [Poriella subacida]
MYPFIYFIINLHTNVIVGNYTTFNQYYSKIKSDIKPPFPKGWGYHTLYGFVMKEVIILGCKQYGFYYYNKNNERIEKAVWAGITRNSISFIELFHLFKGGVISKIAITNIIKTILN